MARYFFICLISLLIYGCSSSETDDGTETTLVNSNLESCGAKYDYFSVSPIEEGDILYISPLGNLNPRGGHSFPSQHLYIHFAEYIEHTVPTKREIYSPGDIQLIRVEEMTYLNSGTTDYSLNFGVCEEVTAYFKHIKGLTDEILGEVGTFSNCNEYESGGESIRRCDKEVSIDLTAGQEIGHVGAATDEYVSFDFGIYDTRDGKLNFVNQSFYPETYYYLRCPLDYYTDSKKADLESKLGGYDGIFHGNEIVVRTIAPVCGEVNQDEENTAKGNWIKLGISTYENEDSHLALVYDNEVPTQGVVSIGAQSGVNNSDHVLFNFIPTSSGVKKRQFEDVTANNTVYCYQSEEDSDSYHINIKMTNNTTLEVEMGNGDCSNTPVITDPTVFVR